VLQNIEETQTSGVLQPEVLCMV